MPIDIAKRSELGVLLTQLAAGEVTPHAVVTRALGRANTNAGRNVFIALDAEKALREAEELPARFPGAGKPALYGLPVSLKDLFDLQGFPTSCGTKFYVEHGATALADSAVAARLREQGAVIVGKTHLHPLAYGITGENPDYGDCVQPGAPQWLTGGSSSGAAASVMEGSALAAIGTDTGGSIRIPAALCGLTGYRASIELARARGLWRGGVPLAGSFDTLGWLFRDLRDGPLLARALFDLEVPEFDRTRVRIGCVTEEFVQDCEPNVRGGFVGWQNRLRDRGAEIIPLDTSFWEEAVDIYAPIVAHESAAYHGPRTGDDFSHFYPAIAERLKWGRSISNEEIAQLDLRLAAFCQSMEELFRECDFVLAPCAPVSRLLAGMDHSESRKMILRYTTPMSLAGVPVVTLPARGGAGVQLIGAPGDDARLLAFAAGLGGGSNRAPRGGAQAS
jgi:Asp-tRNA(Asn)/Glu-tRNA(Gln) amidotransferase A subunit family amidase